MGERGQVRRCDLFGGGAPAVQGRRRAHSPAAFPSRGPPPSDPKGWTKGSVTARLRVRFDDPECRKGAAVESGVTREQPACAERMRADDEVGE